MIDWNAWTLIFIICGSIGVTLGVGISTWMEYNIRKMRNPKCKWQFFRVKDS